MMIFKNMNQHFMVQMFEVHVDSNLTLVASVGQAFEFPMWSLYTEDKIVSHNYRK